jgi:hypothetical protein
MSNGTTTDEPAMDWTSHIASISRPEIEFSVTPEVSEKVSSAVLPEVVLSSLDLHTAVKFFKPQKK